MIFSSKKNSGIFLVLLMAILILPIAVLAASTGTHTPVTGITVGVKGATNNSMTNGAVTVTAKGSGGIFGIGASAKTATITVTNNSSSMAAVSFDWTATSVNQLKIDGKVYSGASGSFHKVVETEGSFTITITTAKDSTENKLVMSNFAITEVSDATAAVTYDISKGSVKLGGVAVSDGDSATASDGELAAVATPASDCTFVGWINKNTNELLSASANDTLTVSTDMVIQAVFVKTASDTAWFTVDGKYLVDNLNTAIDTGSGSTIVLANNATLPAGEYTIPVGKTLLIPYNDANTLCTTKPTTSSDSYKTPTVYRKLTMESGAHIVVNGALSLSAMQVSASGQSSPTDACSFIQMDSNSTITVNEDGKLYAWGFIQGSGAVIVNDKGTVYECFQIMDWRGGSNTTDMIDNEQKVFPFSQYYVQNVEVPMTMYPGAIETCFMSVYISLAGIQDAPIPFIGTGGMFIIDEGYVIKDYDEETGRLLFDLNGTVSVQPLKMTMKLSLIGEKTINSANYVFPINGNMTIAINSGNATLAQDLALLPGSKLFINEGANVALATGTNVYVYDYDEWVRNETTDPSFCGTKGYQYINLKYPASATKVTGRTDDACVEVNGCADLSAGYVYTTNGGANICGTGTIKIGSGTDTVTYQSYCGGSDDKDVTYVDISITSAKLKNADRYAYTDTTTATYYSLHGYWHEAENPEENPEDVPREDIDEAIPATCTTPGLTQGSHCSVCGNAEVIVKQEEIPALGHTEVNDAAVAPTCTDTGLTAGCHCSVCSEVLTAQEEVAALGHTEVTDAAKPATCIESGLTEGKHCSVCSEILVAQEYLPSGQEWNDQGEELNTSFTHNFTKLHWIISTNGTCTTSGTATLYCDDCCTYDEAGNVSAGVSGGAPTDVTVNGITTHIESYIQGHATINIGIDPTNHDTDATQTKNVTVPAPHNLTIVVEHCDHCTHCKATDIKKNDTSIKGTAAGNYSNELNITNAIDFYITAQASGQLLAIKLNENYEFERIASVDDYKSGDKFVFPKVTLTELAEPIIVTVIDSNGKATIPGVTSVQKYANSTINGAYAGGNKTHKLLADLLAFGYELQVYHGKTANLPTLPDGYVRPTYTAAELEEFKDGKQSLTAQKEDYKIASAFGVTEKNIYPGIRITLPANVDPATVKVGIKFGDKPLEYCTYRESYNDTAKARYAYIYGGDSITAKNMADTFTVAVYDANGNLLSATLTYSMQYYAANMASKNTQTALFTAMLTYGKTASEFKGGNT